MVWGEATISTSGFQRATSAAAVRMARSVAAISRSLPLPTSGSRTGGCGVKTAPNIGITFTLPAIAQRFYLFVSIPIVAHPTPRYKQTQSGKVQLYRKPTGVIRRVCSFCVSPTGPTRSKRVGPVKREKVVRLTNHIRVRLLRGRSRPSGMRCADCDQGYDCPS